MAGSRRRLGILIVACVAAGLVIVFAVAALNQPRGTRGPASAGSAPPEAPASASPGSTSTAAPATAAPGPERVIGVLSDSHAYGEDSWWRQSVEEDTVPGLRPGPFEAHPGARTTDLVDMLDDAAAGADLVVVQAGTNDILSGRSPRDAAQGVGALWDGIAERGAEPVAALIPPSETRPALAVELNRLITAEAQARGLPVVDVYTPVAAADGSWLAGLSDDGVHSNKRGSDLMAAAARDQLPDLAR
jgi:hypothetical protein